MKNFRKALKIDVVISDTDQEHTEVSRVQFGDVLFYEFLESIGLMANKSKVIGEINVPARYLFDFLRGVFDGDGSTYSYWDKRWKSSFMFYIQFASASREFIEWLRAVIVQSTGAAGHISVAKGHSTIQLKYAKKDGLVILRRMYPNKYVICLSRKRLKIEEMLRIVGERL